MTSRQHSHWRLPDKCSLGGFLPAAPPQPLLSNKGVGCSCQWWSEATGKGDSACVRLIQSCCFHYYNLYWFYLCESLCVRNGDRVCPSFQPADTKKEGAVAKGAGKSITAPPFWAQWAWTIPESPGALMTSPPSTALLTAPHNYSWTHMHTSHFLLLLGIWQLRSHNSIITGGKRVSASGKEAWPPSMRRERPGHVLKKKTFWIEIMALQITRQ